MQLHRESEHRVVTNADETYAGSSAQESKWGRICVCAMLPRLYPCAPPIAATSTFSSTTKDFSVKSKLCKAGGYLAPRHTRAITHAIERTQTYSEKAIHWLCTNIHPLLCLSIHRSFVDALQFLQYFSLKMIVRIVGRCNHAVATYLHQAR